MGFGVGFSEPYLEYAASAAPLVGVPSVWDVSIGDHTYKVDTEFKPFLRDAFRHRSNPGQRQAIDLTNIPGEGTVNPEGLWRRSMVDWALGAGQLFLDRKDSAANRFFMSKGIDPWTKWQASLLPDVNQIAEASGGIQCIGAGNYAYKLDFAAQTLQYSSDLVTWHTVTGTPSGMSYLCSDGQTVWIAAGSNGIYQTTVGTGSASSYVTGDVDRVAWVAARLIASQGPNLYNILAGGALPTVLLQHPNAGWTWSCFGYGSGQIYIGGYTPTATSCSESGVYRTTIEATGTALTVPVLSLPLGGGEAVTALCGYINLVAVGTNLGFRLCRTISAYDPSGNAGDLEAGPLVPNLLQPVTAPVYGIVGNNRFMYFGWSNYDAESTGIGRVDLSNFIDTLAPAYASDLMCPGAGTVSWLDWFAPLNVPLISVDGIGVFTQAATFVDSGFVDSGELVWDIEDDKTVVAGDIHVAQPMLGAVTMGIATDQRALTEVAVQEGGQPNISPFGFPPLRGQCFNVRLTLTPDDTLGNSPTLFRWTTKARANVVAGTVYSVVLILFHDIDVADGDQWQDAYAEYMYLRNLRETQTIVNYQEGPLVVQVTVDEIDWLPFKLRDEADASGGYDSVCTVYLKDWSPRG